MEKMQLCRPFGVSPYVKILAFPVSALAALAIVGCKPASPPAQTATPTPAPVTVAAEKSTPREGGLGPGAGDRGPGRGEGGGNRPDFVQRSQERLERLKTDLALTEDQVTKIREIFAQQVTTMQAQADPSLDREQRRARMQEAREAVDAQVATILTPEQKAKWEEQRKQRQSEMSERRAKREKDGAPPPPAVQ